MGNSVSIVDTIKNISHQYDLSCYCIESLDQLWLTGKLEESVVLCYVEHNDLFMLDNLSEIKSQCNDVKIIVVSKEFSKDLAVKALRFKLDDYVVYPSECSYLLKLFGEFSGKSLFYIFSSEISSLSHGRQFPVSPQNGPEVLRTGAAKLYIDENFEEKIKITSLAQLCFMSPDYFSKIFKFEVGSTPQEYIKQKRLQAARELLRSTNNSIQEISYQIGYSNQSQFNLLFKQAFSLTPLQYRNLPE